MTRPRHFAERPAQYKSHFLWQDSLLFLAIPSIRLKAILAPVTLTPPPGSAPGREYPRGASKQAGTLPGFFYGFVQQRESAACISHDSYEINQSAGAFAPKQAGR